MPINKCRGNDGIGNLSSEHINNIQVRMISGWKFDEEQDNCLVLKYFPTEQLIS